MNLIARLDQEIANVVESNQRLCFLNANEESMIFDEAIVTFCEESDFSRAGTR